MKINEEFRREVIALVKSLLVKLGYSVSDPFDVHFMHECGECLLRLHSVYPPAPDDASPPELILIDDIDGPFSGTEYNYPGTKSLPPDRLPPAARADSTPVKVAPGHPDQVPAPNDSPGRPGGCSLE